MKCFISHGPRSDLNAVDCLHWQEGMYSSPIVSINILVKYLVQKKTLKSRLCNYGYLEKYENAGESTLFS